MESEFKRGIAIVAVISICSGFFKVPFFTEAEAAAEPETYYNMSEYGGLTLEELEKKGYDVSDGNIEISDYSITSVNREEGVSSDALMSYNSESDALYKADNEFTISLNGTWKFNYVIKPSDKPDDFFKKDYDTSGWADISIPSNTELNGYGVPLYENVTTAMGVFNENYTQSNYKTLAAEMTMPEDYNPVSSYVKTVDIPSSWGGRKTYIVFDGAETCVYLWVNGSFVGYSTDSFTQKIFDITDYVVTGEANTIAARTYTYSNGAWMEDQDYITFSGLSRNVEMYSKPETHIRDFEVSTDFDEDYVNAELTVSANVTGNESESMSVEAVLYDDIEEIARFDLSDNGNYGSDRVLKTSELIKEPKQWSAETPNLYNLVLNLKDENGNVM